MRYLILLVCCARLSSADYFISHVGDDSNAGTAPGKAWRTVGRANKVGFAPGDRILFEGGATFSDATLKLWTDDVGTPGQRIEIGSYGIGRAILRPPPDSEAITIVNTAALLVRDLILAGPGADVSEVAGRCGLLAYCNLPDGKKLADLTFMNIEVNGFYDGIKVQAYHEGFSGFRNVEIVNCYAHGNSNNGIETAGWFPASPGRQSHENIRIIGCEAAHNRGVRTKWVNHTGSGILIGGVKGGLVDRCYAHHNGGQAIGEGGGPVGIWAFNADNVVIQRSLVHDQRTAPGRRDGCGFDLDIATTNCTVQHCFAYGNDGSGFLVCELDSNPPLGRNTVRYNLSWNNGLKEGCDMASGFHIYGGGAPGTFTDVWIYNNLDYADGGGRGCVSAYGTSIRNANLWNNILMVKNGRPFVDMSIHEGDDHTAEVAFQGNCYWAIDGNWRGGWRWGGQVYPSLKAWRRAPHAPETVGGLPSGMQIDPRVSGLDAGFAPRSVAAMLEMNAFRLLADSRLRGAGLDLRVPLFESRDVGVVDAWNGAIPYGKDFDIGPGGAPGRGKSLPVIVSPATANLVVGTPFTYQIIASNSPTVYAVTGLPRGLSIKPATGLISGRAVDLGVVAVTLSATNDGGTGTATLLLSIQRGL